MATEPFFDASFEAALAAARPKQVPVSLGSALNINGAQGAVENTLSANANVPAGRGLRRFTQACVTTQRQSASLATRDSLRF